MYLVCYYPSLCSFGQPSHPCNSVLFLYLLLLLFYNTIVGRLPTQNGVLDYIQYGSGCGDHEGMEYLHKEIAYTDILTKHGYFCALVGKHHLGYDRMAQHSFKHWYVYGRGVVPIPYQDPIMVSNSECIPVKGYTTDVIGDGAIEFLNNYVKRGSADPFYLSVHFTAPHTPHIGEDGRADSMHPKKYVNLYKKASFVSCPQQQVPESGSNRVSLRCHNNRECLKGYYASVTGMDVNIGRIMDTVHKLNLDQDTLIVFASDHGYNAGHHGLWGKGNAAYPLNVFETSLRIPMIWRHTGKIEPGVDESVVQVLDIAPTLLEYAGKLSFPTSANTPGESFADLLLRPDKRNAKFLKERTIYGEYGATRFIRINATTKYVSRLTGSQKQLNLKDDFSQKLELFDLTHDQNETSNLIHSKGLTQEFMAELQSYEKSLQDWFAQYEDKDISSWRELVIGNGQRRPITYAYKHRPRSSPTGLKQAPFKSSSTILKYKKLE